MPSIPLTKVTNICKEIQQANNNGQHPKYKTPFEQNDTFQKRLIGVLLYIFL